MANGKLGEIIVEGGQMYVITEMGKLPINIGRKTIYFDESVIKEFKSGDNTTIQLVKSKSLSPQGQRIIYTLRKIIEHPTKGRIVKSAIGLQEQIAKALFKL